MLCTLVSELNSPVVEITNTKMHIFEFLEKFAEAIAEMEGFNLTQAAAIRQGTQFPTIAQKNKNPGNLRNWEKRYNKSGYAEFASVKEGFLALYAQIALNVLRGLNTYEFFAGKRGVYSGYAPTADGNKPKSYAEYVASRLNIDPNVELIKVING